MNRGEYDNHKHTSRNDSSASGAKYWLGVLVIGLLLVALSGVFLARYFLNSTSNDRITHSLREDAVTVTPVQAEATDVPEREEGMQTPTSSASPELAEIRETEPEKPREYAPIQVDFDQLLSQNEDVVAWLYCEDTPINFPVLKSDTNEYYLYRDFNKQKNVFGSVFMDYACSKSFTDSNTMLFGHDMQNGTQFGSLEKYYDQDYFDRHPVIYLLTPEADYKLELIAGVQHDSYNGMYVLPATDQYYSFFTSQLYPRSTFHSPYEFSESDRFVTLSTCDDHYSGARFALIGVLVALDTE